ncbi:MAG: VCBS repeat-containing protein [Pirellulaceae bacterium]
MARKICSRCLTCILQHLEARQMLTTQWVDLDGDADIDVLEGPVWPENVDGFGNFATNPLPLTGVTTAIDMDGDGDRDVFSDHGPSWVENIDGVFPSVMKFRCRWTNGPNSELLDLALMGCPISSRPKERIFIRSLSMMAANLHLVKFIQRIVMNVGHIS